MATMEITTQSIKQLREKTGVGIMECKTALSKAGGDMKMAEAIIREKCISNAAKKADRETKEGMVDTYIHTGNKIGVMIELNCETDFVAKTEDFKNLARELSMQIAALNPKYVSSDEVEAEELEIQKKLYSEQAKKEGKKEEVIGRIVEGKMSKYFEGRCLLDQPYMRDDSKKIKDLIKEVVGKLGENITVRRFIRYQLGV